MPNSKPEPMNSAELSAANRRTIQGGSFGKAAEQYERGRPAYPEAALDWLLPIKPGRVLDLGAGTGKLTRRIRDRHLDVVAVEPSVEMRLKLTESLPDVTALDGCAEEIPLPDNAVDVVLVAQAWHWVDVERAVVEVARVLSPRGRLGLLWNVRDEREDWVAELGKIIHRGVTTDMNSDRPKVGGRFLPIDRYDVDWVDHLSPERLLDMVASRSSVITMAADERAKVLQDVRDLLVSHPALAGKQDIAMPYQTRCSRALLP
jgi:SAM-dependent methyltransferase